MHWLLNSQFLWRVQYVSAHASVHALTAARCREMGPNEFGWRGVESCFDEVLLIERSTPQKRTTCLLLLGYRPPRHELLERSCSQLIVV